MKRVYICSPFQGDVNQNILYARSALRHSIMRGEAPYAPHLLYTQPKVLRDTVEEERRRGIRAGHSYLKGVVHTKGQETIHTACEICAVYYDRGISTGMMEDIRVASENGVQIEFRSLRESSATSWMTEENEKSMTIKAP